MIQLTKTLALDYAEHKIRVNAICPGTVDTPLVRQHIEGSPDPARAEAIEKQLIPLKRFMQPEEIAHAALYLGPAPAGGITGSAMVIDGGTLAGANPQSTAVFMPAFPALRVRLFRSCPNFASSENTLPWQRSTKCNFPRY